MNKLAIGGASAVLGITACCVGGLALGTTSAVTSQGCALAAAAAPSATPQTPTDALDPWSTQQVAHATTIVTVGHGRDVPPRGWVIALATAMQESNLRNLDHGDRDSIGLFQQRPSQGWGSQEQIMDPAYAAEKFYTALMTVDGWQQMPLTQAAQAVQKSGFPDAYAKWETDAVALAAAVGSANGWAIPEDLEQCVSNGDWTLPVRGPIVSGFRTAERPEHDGVDIAAPRGTPVRAASAGTVVTATCNAHLPNGSPYSCDVDGSPSVRGCGWYLDLQHADGAVTRYCHLLTEPDVDEGDLVHTGQVVGLVGSSGHSSGPHLHLETHVGHPATSDNATEPTRFFADRGVTVG